MEFLSKVIKQKPNKINLEYITSNKNVITEANDQFYKEDVSLKGWASWIFSVVFSFVAFVLLLLSGGSGSLIIEIILFIVAFIMLIYGFIAPARFKIYDRLNGIVFLPNRIGKDATLNFSTSVGFIKYINSSPGVMSGMLKLLSSRKRPRQGGFLAQHNLDNVWAFTVWYMDKNRPLPPGTAFDPYRQKDFERRKAEGFPKPLYPSNIATPEATKAQQAERLRIGKW
ncbi:hypothetical protein [Fulvivirga sediminis]|uniref:Uncharacterized protein n=1 Tax=Fulvivirga sediminis TaxID=2803949 RepID=A0A937FDQ7_9BACT|nr:hypothetical protein [Fulvivirga sediminis]MBL3658879.1 hypothetical protein [Fulvivirga sediminis]